VTARASDIRAAVRGLVAAADTDAVVYSYGRFASDWSDFLDLFLTTVGGSKVIRGWEVYLTRIDDLPTGTDRFSNVYHVQVRGYFGLDDSAESEKTAFNAAEDVLIHLRKYRMLDGTLTQGSFKRSEGTAGMPSLDVFERRSFGGAICHYAEINFMVCENETVTYAE